jgi:anti-sigma B factor antagonist
MTFSISVSPDRINYLAISGALDAETASQLEPMLDALFVHAFPRVEIDLSELRMIDSIGVGVLVAVYKRLRARGAALTFRGLSDQPLALFRLLRLDRLMADSAVELC